MALTERELKIHLAKALRESPGARVYAFYWTGKEPPVTDVEAAGSDWHLQTAPSELAIRDALETVSNDGNSNENNERIVLLTPLRNRDVEFDTLARLADTEIAQFDPWEPLQYLFGASSVDSRLRNDQEMRPLGDALMACSARGADFEPVSSGMLAPETAWKAFYRHGLSFEGSETDLSDWCLWALQSPGGVTALLEDFQEVVEPLEARLRSSLGPEAALFLTVLRRESDRSSSGPTTSGSVGSGTWAFAAGLAADAIRRARNDDGSSTAPIEALTRLKDRYETDEKPSAELLADFGRAANSAWQRLEMQTSLQRDNAEAPTPGDETARIVSEALDTMLENLVGGDADQLLKTSPASQTGWRRRVASTSDAICEALEGAKSIDTIAGLLEELSDHFGARADASTFEALRDAARLAAWLQNRTRRESKPLDQNGLAELARRHLLDGSFADTLRERLTAADVGPDVQRAVRMAVERSLEHTEDLNDRFSELLAGELREHTAPRGALGIQQVLEQVVAPLADRKPVLVAVLDGMSWGVARALLSDSKFNPWSTWAPADADDGREASCLPVFATVPSTTRNSRASLLTGQLQSGGQSVEREGFARRLRDLGAVRRLKDAPLFHKAEVDAKGRGQIGSEVRTALEDDEKQVVGVVINAIDDQLSGSDQLSVDWDIDTVTPLRSLLDYAAHRTVVLVSDHGHVWETDTERDIGATSARWRAEGEELVDGERVFEGAMIRELTGDDAIVAAWSERLRYTRGKAGYHGGASLQEVVAPLVVLDRNEDGLADRGFTRLSTAEPAWWHFEEPTKTVEVPEETASDTEAPEERAQLDLLDEDSEVAAIDTDWIVELVNSALFDEQLKRHGAGLDTETIARLLAHLQANNDRLPLAAVARLFSRSKARTRSLLTVVREVLNLEGYQALRFASLEGIVKLDRQLLRRQFGLD